jgi:hypothetical protein
VAYTSVAGNWRCMASFFICKCIIDYMALNELVWGFSKELQTCI